MSHTRLMSWYRKRKPTRRKDLITYNITFELCFLLIDWLTFGGGSFEIVRPRSRRWKNVGRRWTKGVRGLLWSPQNDVAGIVPRSVRLTLKKISNIVLNVTNIHLFNVSNGNARTMCEICSKLTVNTLERRHWRSSSIFIGSSE